MRPDERGGRLSVSLIILTVVLGLTTVIGFVAARHYYIEFKTARLDPTARPSKATIVGEVDKPRRRIVIIGDSRVARWTDHEQIAGYSVVLSGIEAQTSAQVRARFERDAIASDPDAIVVAAGINDLVAAMLVPDRERDILIHASDNLAAMVDAARKKDIPVVLMTVVQPADPPLWRLPLWSERIRLLVNELNANIKMMEEPPAVRVLDAAAQLGDGRDRIASANSADTLHFSRQAYGKLNAALTQLFSLYSDAVQ